MIQVDQMLLVKNYHPSTVKRNFLLKSTCGRGQLLFQAGCGGSLKVGKTILDDRLETGVFLVDGTH